jgi:NitT/TauT family transport system substrate-binding protein
MLTSRMLPRVAALALAAGMVSTATAADRIRLVTQRTGSLAWELDVIKAHGLDKAANLDIDTLELASTEAGKVALKGGSADVIVSDWTWVARERALGDALVYYPYLSTLGAVMAPAKSPIRDVTDLKGKKLAVAGGPIDKSWLLLQASLQQDGINLKSDSTIVYGAAPLVAAQMLNGDMDATVNYWNFCAALEEKGFRRIAAIQDLVQHFGAKGPVAMVGYVFDEAWASANRDRLARFIDMTRRAKQILTTSDSAWDDIAKLTGAGDAATVHAYRDRYREGIPHRRIEDEEKDARVLYRVLAGIGGHDLVGPAADLDPGTYYHALPGD